jgi:hypothetical protein
MLVVRILVCWFISFLAYQHFNHTRPEVEMLMPTSGFIYFQSFEKLGYTQNSTPRRNAKPAGNKDAIFGGELNEFDLSIGNSGNKSDLIIKD